MSDFLTDIKTLRKRSREHIEHGPIDLRNLLKKLGS